MSNSILSTTSLDVNLKTQVEGEYNLDLGERWEQHSADYLTASGLPAYRACQRFVSAKDLQTKRKQYKRDIQDGDYEFVSCELRYTGKRHSEPQMLRLGFMPHSTYRVLAGDPSPIDYSLLRQHQRDILVKIDKVRRLSIEVKALTPSAFNRAYIQVGCCDKYDKKRFRIDALVLINQLNGEAFAFTGDTTEMLRQRDADGSDGYSYAIEKAKLKPIDAWIDAIKDIHELA